MALIANSGLIVQRNHIFKTNIDSVFTMHQVLCCDNYILGSKDENGHRIIFTELIGRFLCSSRLSLEKD